MDSLTEHSIEFRTTTTDGRYTKVALSDEYRFGFIVRESGYVSGILGPDSHDIEQEFDLDAVETIMLYERRGKFYYPDDSMNRLSGSFDIYVKDPPEHHGDVLRYDQSVTNYGEDTNSAIFYDYSPQSMNDKVVMERKIVDEKLKNGEFVALWPLFETAHR